MIVYISEQGAGLYIKGRRILIKKQGKVLQTIHANRLEQLILMGRVALSPVAINFLLKNNIDTVFMSLHGEYRGRLVSGYSKNIELRIAQFKKAEELDFLLAMAKECVRGKLENYRYYLRRLFYDSKREEIESVIHRLRAIESKLEKANNLDEVRGYEGAATADYFSVFKFWIKNQQFEFGGRTRRPPRDEVNAMLSFGYMMLMNVVNTYCYIVGLDPFLGNLHGVDYGRPSLALDLMEEFRPVVVDSLVIRLINKGSFSKHDFEVKVESEDEKSDECQVETKYYVLMNKEGMKKFIHYFENKLAERVFYYPLAQKLTYRMVIEKQVRLYASALKGAEYRSFTLL
jgi:CRISPR-associated protein Cas1